jgi:hypothetical protein
VALLVTAIPGSLFLLEATFFGWAIGVTLRAMSLVLVFGMLGIGVFNLRFNQAMRSFWAEAVVKRPSTHEGQPKLKYAYAQWKTEYIQP